MVHITIVQMQMEIAFVTLIVTAMVMVSVIISMMTMVMVFVIIALLYKFPPNKSLFTQVAITAGGAIAVNSN